MEGFPGAPVDLAQLQASMQAVEQACSSIQMHYNPAEAEKLLVLFRQSPMPYQSCRFILEKSQLAIARFQAAGAIRDAALREWGVLTDENKRSLILFCLCYVMEHSSAIEAYVQSKVSAVAAQLVKRGWLDFADAEKVAIFSEVKQAVLGVHGAGPQFAGINFLESLVSEFSPSTSTAMGLPTEFHDQCQSSLELNYLKEFYCWAQDAAYSVTGKLVEFTDTTSEEKVCSAALRLMFQILNWDFKLNSSNPSENKVPATSGIRHEASLLKKFERSLVQPGPTWHGVLISSDHVTWLLNLYTSLRERYSSDVIWGNSPVAVSARQLIIQLCSLAGTIFPSDNGQTQIKHIMQILSAVIQWLEPPDVVAAAISSGHSESELIDGCHVLLSVATLTSATLFDNLLRSLRSYGTLHLLSALTSEVVKADAIRSDEEETWTSEALDVLLETWNVILARQDFDKDSISTEGIGSSANLFNTAVECLLNAAVESAFEDDSESDHFVASVSKRDERLASYALISRVAANFTIPFLMRVFSERVSRLNQQNNGSSDPTHTLEELYWLLLITAHVLTDSGEGETPLIPEELKDGFPDVVEEMQHPVVILSWSILDFARWSLDPKMRAAYFSPRLMEAIIWFLARWVDTYLMPFDAAKGHIEQPFDEHVQANGSRLSKRILYSFAGEHNQGGLVLDVIIRICTITLTSYPGEIELQALTCQKLLVALVRRKNVCTHLVTLDAWRDLAKAFSTERTLFPITSRLQRSLAETIVSAAVGLKDSEASNQYVKDIMGSNIAYIVEIASKNDLNAIAQQADVIYIVSCMFERLRGAARVSQPRIQKGIFEMGHAVMNPLLTLLEAYKNQPAVVYLILKFVVDLVEGQLSYLNAKETSILVAFCLRLLQVYSSHNIGKISLSLSRSLRNEAQAEKYKDLRALLQLLINISSKDLVDFSSVTDETEAPDIGQVIYVGLHIVSPLISLDLLRYPKLGHDYFALVSHMLEVYPEKVAQLNTEAFVQIIGTLDFGIQHQDTDIVDMCLRAVYALASFHYKERVAGRGGLGAHAVNSQGLQESILRHLLRMLLQLFVFEDSRIDLAGSAADALFPLLLCEQELYQILVQEFLERQLNPALKTRLARALHSLTSSNQLSSVLDRPNCQRFRKNFLEFLTEISGLRIK